MPVFSTLQTDVLNLAGGDTSGDDLTMAKAAINRIYRQCLDAVDADHEHREFSLTVSSGTSQYAMPHLVKTVLNIEDSSNQRRIYSISPQEFDSTYPGNTDAGAPIRAYKLGTFGVGAQTTQDEAVTIESSSTSDSGSSFNVRVQGTNSAGVLVSEKLQLNGTTPVTGTTTWDTGGLQRVTKLSGSSWSGYLTLKGATSGETFATIPVWWQSPTYQWWEFHPIPSSSITYTVRAVMRKPDLVDDEDWPEIDEDFHSLLVWGAAAELLPATGNTSMADRLKRDFENGLARYASGAQIEPNRVRVFADVMNAPYTPQRPLIRGIDYL